MARPRRGAPSIVARAAGPAAMAGPGGRAGAGTGVSVHAYAKGLIVHTVLISPSTNIISTIV
eukprot:SAG31_NODE_6435_length_2020_cov_4.287350_2_plen_62_part_00